MFQKLTYKFFFLERAFYQQLVDNYFERDLKKDNKVFQGLHPKDDFGRCIAQHKCQVYPFKKNLFLLNCMAVILTPVIFVSLLVKKRVLVKDDLATIVCYNCFNLPSSLPEAFNDKKISCISSGDCPYYLSGKDVSFLFRFFIRSFFHPFLSFRVLLKVAKYRTIFDSFSRLESIAITGEFSDTSSAMTQYCHERGIQHYNFLQGDMFGSPRIAFFHFDKCYVWDHHYVDIFVEYGACPEQFEISASRLLKKIESDNTNKTIDYLYYLGGYPNEDLIAIRTAMDKLIALGFSCEIRPHPHWSDMDAVKKVFEGVSIQDTKAVNVDDSILMTRNVIGLCSTVLIQAYYNNVNVVIDDLSCPEKFKMLEGYKYIMLNKPHKLLSEITNC